jgi:hypothetical protein
MEFSLASCDNTEKLQHETLLPAQLFQTQPSKSDQINMSKEYEGRDPLDIAAQAEQDLNSHERKFGVQDGTGFGGKTVGGGSTSSRLSNQSQAA